MKMSSNQGVIKMNRFIISIMTLLLLTGFAEINADIFVQCPGDLDGDAIPDEVDPEHPNAVCMHLAAGDGFVNMGDGKLQYMFGFSDVTGVMPEMVMMEGMLNATFPSPTITLKEGQELYLTVTNVGMMVRPDLFDPHTVHWHGFANAASVFDGVPEASLAINMMSSITYYYKVVDPGTYLYHCHVEATEHMQMGMLGNLYVTPAQDELPDGTDLNGFTHHTGYTYAYNDGDGTTYYDVDFPIQMHSFDPDFHDASLNVQPLPFAEMWDRYAMLNGRGYPDTANPDELPNTFDGRFSQKTSSLIEATAGDIILLRLSNLSVTRFFTLAVMGIPMKIIAKDSRLLRGPDGKNLYYDTNSITMGGGQAADALLDTSQVEPGTYCLYTTNLNYLSNNDEDFGGMMTEIIINAP